MPIILVRISKKFINWLKAVLRILERSEEMSFLSFSIRGGEIKRYERNIENLVVKNIGGFSGTEKSF